MSDPAFATYELVRFDPDDASTYPSVCADAGEVEARFGFTGGETLLFDSADCYQGQVVNRVGEEP
jgi:hypothetical protein